MREINTITAFCPFANKNRQYKKSELLKFINSRFSRRDKYIKKIDKIEKSNSKYIIDEYEFTKDDFEEYIYNDYIDFMR